jgi:hypothetical protein
MPDSSSAGGTQAPRTARDGPDAGVAAGGFEAADFGGIHADALGEGFLGEAVGECWGSV